MATIFVIGYMASGKTTFGRALARRLGYEFIDLDFYITQRFRRSVAQLFAEKGEAWFRARESDMLREIGEMDNTVIACGGGTPCFDDNMEFMNSHGLTVLLEASEDCTLRRLLEAKKGKRPLTAGKSPDELREFIRTHKAERAPFYGKARLLLPSDDLESSRQIDLTVDRFLAMVPDLQTTQKPF